MYAVVKVGSSQFKVSEGDTIQAHRMDTLEEGKDISLDQVLLFSKDSDIRIGKPFLKDVKVTAKVVKHSLGVKSISFRFRKRKNSSKIRGHRRQLTTLNITKISA